MIRRKAFLCIAGVLSLAGAMVTTEAMAAFQACQNFTVTLQNGSCVPAPGGKEVCTWDVSGGALELSKISHIEFAPLAQLNASAVSGDEGDVTVADPGNGGTGSFKYAQQIPAVDVVTVTSFLIQSGGPVRFQVDGPIAIGDIGVHSKAGNKEEVCVAEGPIVPPPPASFTSASLTCVNLTGTHPILGPFTSSIEFSRNSTGCIGTIEAFNQPDCQGDGLPPNVSNMFISEENQEIFEGSIIPGQCPNEAITIDQGSPFFLYDGTSGGQAYKWCIDLADGSFSDLANCEQ